MEHFDHSNLVRNYFKSYETKERETLEELLSQDFTFSSPVDDQINWETYFVRCWPSCKEIFEYRIQNIYTDGNEAVIRYECELNSGAVFQNMELFRFSDGKIKEIKVYFGFDLRQEPFAEEKVKRFNKAFVSGDTDYIMKHIADDVHWHFVGESELRGREAVKSMLEPMRGVASTVHRTKNIITNGNKAVIEGTMKMPKENGRDTLYAFCDIYTFNNSSNETINELTAYLIELPGGEEANNE